MPVSKPVENPSPACPFRWERKGPRQYGSADRAQRGVYAVRVTEELTGVRMDADGMLTCPLTGERFSVENGEVDKVQPHLGYIPTNIVMVSKAGNQGRATMQQWGDDMPGIDRYRNDVLMASMRVGDPMRKIDACAVWQAMGKGAYTRKVVAGPYGVK